MANEVLDYLRERFNRVDTRLDDIARSVRELGQRLTLLESSVAQFAVTHANFSLRLDHVNDRLERIERRLELIDQPLVKGQ